MLNTELNVLTAKRSTTQWVEDLNAAGVPCGPIYAIDEMFDDAQVKHLCIARDVPNVERRDLKLFAQPFSLSRTSSAMAARTSKFSEQAEEVLAEFGSVSEGLRRGPSKRRSDDHRYRKHMAR